MAPLTIFENTTRGQLVLVFFCDSSRLIFHLTRSVQIFRKSLTFHENEVRFIKIRKETLKFAYWPLDCMKILNLHCVVTKSLPTLGFEISRTTIKDITKYVMDYEWTFNWVVIYLIVYQIQTHIAYCFGHQIVWTSCTFKHVKHGFYLWERFSNMYILGMRVRISV